MSDRITPEQAREHLRLARFFWPGSDSEDKLGDFIDQAERDEAELARLRAVGPLTPKPE